MATTSSPVTQDNSAINTSNKVLTDAELANLGDGDLARMTKSIRRKIDLRMLPLLGMLYAVSLVDRSNLGLARAAGMDHDLGLSIGARYSIASSIYFIPYICFQLPSNLYLRKLGVRNWLSFSVIAWGFVELGMGFVRSWGYLAFCRVLLGAFEAVFFPAMVYIITTWYTRHEVQKRLAAFYVVSILVGGFSAIFAYGLTLLNGRFGIPGWSWIFIIEGAITIAFGIIAWFYLPSFPDQNTFLTPDETALILQRVERDRGDSVPDILTSQKLIEHLLDWKVWVTGVMYMCATTPAYAISFFVTPILIGMGWDVAGALLLSAPPYVFTSMSVMIFAWLSDKYRQRAIFIAIQAGITLLGLCMMGFVPNAGWKYAGIFLANAGCSGCIPGILAYSSNNIISHSKRAVTTAITVAFGGIGGIFATTIFRQADAPTYLPGIYATIVCQLLMWILLCATTAHFWRRNEATRKGLLEKPLEGRVGFFYTL